MLQRLIILSTFCFCLLTTAMSQQYAVSPRSWTEGTDPLVQYGWGNVASGDTIVLPQFSEPLIPVCKRFYIIPFTFALTSDSTGSKKMLPLEEKPRSQSVPWLTVKGNVLYDVSYRSLVDTPFAEKNVYQHTLQTRLDFLYKNRYPFKLYLTTHFSNTPLFRNYTDPNIQFTQADFLRLLKNKLLQETEAILLARLGKLDSLKRRIDSVKELLSGIRHAIQKPDVLQRLVEEREKQLLGSNKNDTLASYGNLYDAAMNKMLGQQKYKFPQKRDSLFGSFADTGEKAWNQVKKEQQKADSLTAKLDELEQAYRKASALADLNKKNWKSQIEHASRPDQIKEILQRLQLPDTLLPKGYKTLSALQTVKVGRTMANYSELSVKDLSISGLQVEYNPAYFYAFAVGKVDYRFRDYILGGRPQSGQYVALARFGKGTKNGNHLFFTYYTGKRQFFNSSIAAGPNSPIPSYNLAGFTIEGFYRVNKTTTVVGEIAKSTVPFYSLDSQQRKNWIKPIASFKDRSNEAYSLQLNSFFPKTQTRFTGNVRYLGANFQSFSTFTTGAAQLKWVARLEQPFFQRKLNITTSLQQNDYTNPFVLTAYKNSSLLASFQAGLRIPNWPVLSLGYYPSYQLTKIDDDHYSESRYYTMVGNAGYDYQVHHAQLSTYIVYSQFYNQASDSGFVYFNSKNLLLSQNLTLNKISFLLNFSESINTGYKLYTVENNEQVTISPFLSIGGGTKIIRYTLLPSLLWGYSGNLRIRIPKLGDIQFLMDKGFIPGLSRQLAPNNTGRLTYFKTF